MSRRTRVLRRCSACVPALLLAVPLALSGQTISAESRTLPLKRDVPPVVWSGCVAPASAPPVSSAEDQAEAARLAAEATDATILGDNDAALSLLAAAATLDPRSERVAYLRARSLELLGRGEDALVEYCRYLGLAPDGAERVEVGQRIDTIVAARPFTVGADAAQAYSLGITHLDAGRPEEAEVAFTQATAAAPNWAAALYNRGVVRLALGETAAAASDLRRYLELSPGAADLGAVLDVIGTGPAARANAYNPGSALAAGLIVPGLGHFTTGRPGRGALFFVGAAGMAGAGVLVTKSQVECLSPPVGGQCPSDQVLRETTTRPLLLPAMLAAVATGFIGAIDAYRGAARSNTGPTSRPSAAERSGLSLGPADLTAGAGGARLTLVRLRF